MSPIIDLQRRLVEVGRIRMGEKNAKGLPTRLATWKLTSRDRVRLDAAAAQFGGEVIPWEGHDGQFALQTERDALPILLMPGQTLTSWYELWSGGGCQRRCDGTSEQVSDGPCLCDPEARECKPHTRLNVLLQDVPGIGCWRLETKGYYAAVELAGTVDLLELATARGALLPARLRIDQRVQVKDGQTKKFPVPTLDIDVRPLEMVAITRQAAAGEIPPTTRLELPAGVTPVAAPQTGVSVGEGLAAAEKGAEPAVRTARSAAPIGPQEEFEAQEPIPVPDGDAPVTEPPEVSAKLKKKADTLVGKLRKVGKITTEQLYIATGRNAADYIDENGELHWKDLREMLAQAELSQLVDRLERYEANLKAAV